MTDPLSSCPDCGAPLPPDSPQSLCPACLMRQALASRTIISDGGKSTHLPPPTPEEIADKFPGYEILECLGRGGMGVVYKARQKSLNRVVAIKILAPERVGDGKFAERFSIEAELLAKLSHPHIVTIHDFGETGGLFYLVMEFIDGVNLRDLLRDGKLEPKQALAIVPPICDALQYAHDKGIVHRDIKPENILLDREGRVKIADFGIASLVGASGENSGTPPYMAPEQNGGTVDRRADIYALGVVLYEMLTGERPEKDLVAPSKRVEVDVRIDEMVLRALEKEPERRYQTAGEFRTVAEVLGTRNAAVGSMSSLPRQSGDSGMTIPLRFEWLVIGLAALVILGAIAHFNLTFGVSKSTMILAGVMMLVTGLVGVMFRPAHRKPDLLWKEPPLFSDAVESVTGCIRSLRKRRGWERPASMGEASDNARLTRTPSVRMANLAFGLSIVGALIPVAFLWADSPESFEHNVIRGWIVTGATLTILVAAIGLSWSTRRLARGKAALIAASLSLLIAGASIIAGLQRPIQFDTPIIVKSPDGSMSGMGMTLHSMRVFDSDRITYRLLVEGENGGETWMSEIPLEQEGGVARPLNDLSFEKRGKIDWSEDGETVSFRVGDTPIAVFDINATRWKTDGLLGDDFPAASVVQPVGGEPPYPPEARTASHYRKLSGIKESEPGSYRLEWENGITFEVVGLLRNPRESTSWFRPDGTPFEKPVTRVVGVECSKPVESGTHMVHADDEIVVLCRRAANEKVQVERLERRWIPNPLLLLPGAQIDPKKDSDSIVHFALRDTQRSLGHLDLEVGIVCSDARWETMAIYDGQRTKEVPGGSMVVFSPPRYEKESGRHVIDVMHNIPTEKHALRVTAKMHDGRMMITDFHSGVVSGTPTKGYITIFDHDFDIREVKEYVLERTEMLGGRIPRIVLPPRMAKGSEKDPASSGPAVDEAIDDLIKSLRTEFIGLNSALGKGDSDEAKRSLEFIFSREKALLALSDDRSVSDALERLRRIRNAVESGDCNQAATLANEVAALGPELEMRIRQRVLLDEPDQPDTKVMDLEKKVGDISFGPEAEAVLPLPKDDFPWLDLESGEFLTMADDPEYAGMEAEQRKAGELFDFHLDDGQAAAWRKKHGLDVAGWKGDRPGGLPAVMALDLSQVQLEVDQWQTLTPAELDVLLRVRPEKEKRGVEGEGAVMGLRSQEGSLGLLQFMGLSEDGRGVKIRYKLWRTQTASSAVQPNIAHLIISKERGGRITPDGILHSIDGELVAMEKLQERFRQMVKERPELQVIVYANDPELPAGRVHAAVQAAHDAGVKHVRVADGEEPADAERGADGAVAELKIKRPGVGIASANISYHSISKMIAGAVGFLLLAALAFFMHRRINPGRRLEMTALYLCVAGVILPLLILIGHLFGIEQAVVSSVAFVLFAVMQLAALILGVIRFSEPLGRAAAIVSGILLLGSILSLS